MKLLKRKPHAIHRGNMLLQLGIVMAIILFIAPGAMDRYAGMQQEKVWTGTASHLSFVAQAGKRYVRDNRDKLLTQVTGGPVVIRVEKAIPTAHVCRFLPFPFPSFRGSWCMVTACTLRALTTPGLHYTEEKMPRSCLSA